MDKKLLWRACLLGLLLAILSTSAALAASSQQVSMVLDTANDVTPTATPLRWFIQTPTLTATLEGGASPLPPLPAATPLPTVTLSPPPVGGGRVAVEVLYIREEPSFGSAILSSLFYDDPVLPVGRNAEGDWIAIEWEDGVGWLWASLVFWDPSLDVTALTILSDGADLPVETPSPAATSPTPSSTTTSTPTTVASITSAPSPTSTPPPQSAATAVPALTTQPETSGPNPLSGIQGSLQSGALIGGGIVLLGFVAYVWRRSAGTREVQRYAKGFLLDTCPACHEGRLQLDEIVHRSMGVPSVRRSVRCSACRSVLREIRPGRWRYTVDPFANPDMASRYKDRRLSRADLQSLQREAIAAKEVRLVEEETPFAEPIDDSILNIVDEDSPVEDEEATDKPAEEVSEETIDEPVEEASEEVALPSDSLDEQPDEEK